MNTRLSQRVYSEAALEFWLQRLEGDWEGQFSEAELSEGRRLYRRGAVRQLELGDTDAIVHMRPEGAEEVYVVLDWQGVDLAIRASVEEADQRRKLAVAGLYEVEELVGDEVGALPAEMPVKPAATEAGEAGADTSAEANTATIKEQNADIEPESARRRGGQDASGQSSEADEQGKHSNEVSGQTISVSTADGQAVASTASSASTASDSASANREAGGQTSATSGEHDSKGLASDTTTQTAEAAFGSTDGKTPPVPERQLALHFSLRQSSLLFRASWRQKGRRRLVPALGEAAPSAETMTAEERETLIRLASLARRSGFRYDKGQGGYQLDNPERMEQFVSRELGGWSEFFEITQETDVALLARGVQEVSLRARIGENAEGSLSLHWMAGFEQDLPGSEYLPAFTAAERRRLLRSGAEPLLLPGRGLVRLSPKQAKVSEHLTDAVSLFPGGTAPRYLLFSLTGLSDLPVEISASLQRWRQSVLGGNLASKTQKKTALPQDVAAAVAGRQSASEAEGEALPLPDFLRPYQRLGIGWMRHLFERGCHGLLADEMGLGKTVQVLSLIATAPPGDKPTLVVCPASVVPVWQAQAAQFFPQLKIRVLGAGCTFVGESPEPTDLWLASYTQLRRHKSQLDQVQFELAVLDEAQFIKNPEAKVTQACLALKAEHRLALTGTPLENRYLDVWTLFRFLMPGLLGTRRRFEETLANDEARHLMTLRKQLAPFILRRTKSEVADELPEKVELDLYCPLTDVQRTEYRRLLAEGMALYGGTTNGASAAAHGKQDSGTVNTAAHGKEGSGTVNTAAHGKEGSAAVNAAMHGKQDDSTANVITNAREDNCGTSAAATAGQGNASVSTTTSASAVAGTIVAEAESIDAESVDAGSAGTAPVAAEPASMQSTNTEPAGMQSAGGDGRQPGVMSVLTLLTRLRQVACDPALLPWMQEAGLHHSGKLNLLRDRLGEVFANGKKAVVFSQFVKFLDRAKQAIAADYPDVAIHQLIGTTRDRSRPVERFQSQEGAGVMLVSLKAGGTGITLHAADYVFLLDPWWNPAVEAQAIDRVHRIGQVNRVFVYRMVTAQTVEARIAALKQTKRERFEQIMSGASGGDDFREAFRSLESLLGLLKQSDTPQLVDAAASDADLDTDSDA